MMGRTGRAGTGPDGAGRGRTGRGRMGRDGLHYGPLAQGRQDEEDGQDFVFGEEPHQRERGGGGLNVLRGLCCVDVR
eukprot:SAG22_NODE_1251_length_5005_cov_22.891154_2_plen_77_part_00